MAYKKQNKLYNFIKIMNTLPEEKYTRNQKYKKQDYYRHPLDQQKDYNSRLRQQPPRDSFRSDSDANQVYQSRQSYPEINYDNEGILPPIRTQNKQNIKLQALAMRLRGQEDKTQIYLKNCEYIIKNLRELKQKKQKDHYLTMSTEPTPKDEHQREFASKQDFQYYPKNQQFSSQGKPYNKLYPVQAAPKYKQNLKKLDEDFYNKSFQYESSSVRVKSLPKKVIKNAAINKYEIEPREDRNYYRSQRGVDDDQSDIPSGIDERRIEPKPYRRFSSSKSSQRNTPINKTTQNKERESQRDKKQQKQKEDKQAQNVKVQKELISCLSELTQFLRNQNIHTNKQPTKQTANPPNKQNQNVGSANNTNNNNNIPQQIQCDNDAQNSKVDQKDNNKKGERLKEKAIVALKKLNQKSKGFVDLTTNRLKANKTKEQPSQVCKKRPSVTFIENVDHIPPKQVQTKANPQKAEEQKTLKPILSIPVNVKTGQNQSPITSRQTPNNNNIDEVIQKEEQTTKQMPKQSKSQSLNSELAKQLVSFLQKQENQNIQLSFCLKELTQFLKIQNDEMVEMKSSRYQQEKAMGKTLSPRKNTIQPHEIPEEEEEQEELQKGKTSKLQQAVLKKLKKARLRGNIFKQKVQSFRKSHHLIITKKQARSKQVQKDVEIEPVTVGPAEGAGNGQNEGQSSPVKQVQATKS